MEDELNAMDRARLEILRGVEIRSLTSALRSIAGAAGGMSRYRVHYDGGHEIDCKHDTDGEHYDPDMPYSWCLLHRDRVLHWGRAPSMHEAVLAAVKRLCEVTGEEP